jgi:hypothetical protein
MSLELSLVFCSPIPPSLCVALFYQTNTLCGQACGCWQGQTEVLTALPQRGCGSSWATSFWSTVGKDFYCPGLVYAPVSCGQGWSVVIGPNWLKFAPLWPRREMGKRPLENTVGWMDARFMSTENNGYWFGEVWFLVFGFWFCFCSTGAWTQGLHFETLHQPF